jgi:hypothetical protein
MEPSRAGAQGSDKASESYRDGGLLKRKDIEFSFHSTFFIILDVRSTFNNAISLTKIPYS